MRHEKRTRVHKVLLELKGLVMNVLVVDVGGTNVKVLATGQKEPRKFPSGPKMTPKQMVSGVKKITLA
jgi:hypothetical protein